MNTPLASPEFWVDTGDRAVRAFAQGTLGALGLGVAGVVAPGVSVPWVAALVCGGFTAAISVLASLAGMKIPAAAPPPSALRGLLKR